jgi:hypothetical protein
MKSQSFAVRSLKTQIAATLKLIGTGIKKYILQLLDLEAKLEAAMSKQIKPCYSEAQIKEAFIKANGCIKRYWQPEMIELIPQLIGLKIRGCDPWDWMSQFAPIQKMDELGWSDREIVYCIDASKILVGQNPY